MSDSQPRNAWRGAFIAIVILLILVGVLYPQPVSYLLSRWNQLSAGDYGHGYLVLAISVYLIYHNRHALVARMPCPEYRAVPVVLAASLFWMAAALVDIAVLQAVALLFLVLSIVWALTGNRAVRVLVFPILYIGFAIPVWFPLSPVLQNITADVVFWAIRIFEVPAYRVENIIVLPAGRMSVQEACSGLRYLLAALTLGTFYAYLNYSTLTSRIIVVLVFAGAAVLSNILRVFIVVYLAYTTEMQHPLVDDHLNLGWYLYAGLIALLLVIETVILRNRRSDRESGDALNETSDAVTVHGQPPEINCQGSLLFAAVVLAGSVSLAPLSVNWINDQKLSEGNPVKITMPVSSENWLALIGKDDWTPQYNGATAHKMIYRDKEGRKVFLYLGIYSQQRQGEELINDLNRISNNERWSVKYQKVKLYNTGERQIYEQLLENKEGSQRLAWYWYRVAGKNTVNKYQAKMLQVRGLLQGDTHASVIAIASSLEGAPDDTSERTRKTLQLFVEEMGETIDSMIDGE